MVWLEAALAFALTMLIFSTIAAAIVEIIHNLLGLREAGFRRAVIQLYHHVLQPRFDKHLERADEETAIPDQLASLLLAVCGNDVYRPANEDPARSGWRRFWTGFTNFLVRLGPVRRKVQTLTATQFAERLAETDVGKAILAEGEQAVDTLIRDIAQKYERFGESARDFFRRRAQIIVMIISVALAFAVNIDAIQIFRGYLSNDQLRASVIANEKSIIEGYELAQKRLQKTLDDAKKVTKGEVDEALEKAISKYKDIEKELKKTRAAGIPFGWSYFPFSCEPADAARSKTCLQEEHFWPAAGAVVAWFFSVLLTGLLIGLGGPFWFNAAKSLSTVLQLVRGIRGGAPTQAKDQKRAAAVSDTENVPTTPVEAFKTAARGTAHPGEPIPRPLLDSEGKIIG